MNDKIEPSDNCTQTHIIDSVTKSIDSCIIKQQKSPAAVRYKLTIIKLLGLHIHSRTKMHIIHTTETHCIHTHTHTHNIHITTKTQYNVKILLFVGSCLATKVFIGNLLAMGRDWVIIK